MVASTARLSSRCAAHSFARSPAAPRIASSCHVGGCTPFVIATIDGASSTCFHIARAVRACSSLTPLARRDSRSPAAVMLKGSPPIARISAPESWSAAPMRRSSLIGCSSFPALTGVWVVNTIFCRVAAHASGKVRPPSIASAIISIPANTAWPSLK